MLDPHEVLAHSTLFLHWWQYYFVPVHEVWWRGAVWGNIFAMLPAGIIAGIAYLWHIRVTTPLHKRIDALHESHAKIHSALEDFFDAIDPETDGGIGPQVSHIEELADETKPGGITVVLEEIKKR